MVSSHGGGSKLPAIGGLVIAIAINVVLVLGVTWLADVMYAAGFWPVGAVLRVVVLLLIASAAVMVLGAIGAIFGGR
ncbi:MAG: hypothetical protein KatS3mg062_0868 [Tepidiforma sp.]|nr:MAG: hypothetical protein KatS3mg062_0868 [Tepidiforma sp.]